jgi:hypothetical protein
VRDTLLALVLVILALGVRRYYLEGLSLAYAWCFYHWKVLQLGFDYALHEFVSVFLMQNFLIEWLLIKYLTCIVTLLLLCLIIETLGSQHTSRLWLHVPMIKAC